MDHTIHPPDTLQVWGRSTVQFGPLNDRVYLMQVHIRDYPQIVHQAEEVARGQGLGKILAKVPRSLDPGFQDRGYIVEARIPGLFSGQEEGVYLGKFMRPERGQADTVALERSLQVVRDLPRQQAQSRPRQTRLQVMAPEWAEAMARVYRRVFVSYPFPLFDPRYIQSSMSSHVRYYGAVQNGAVVALASCEMDTEHGYVEMTDFATLPEARGRGLAACLLQRMQEDMRTQGLQTAFTIARAQIGGINALFARNGYTWGGTLINNTHMDGSLESMHVWWLPLQA